MRLICRSPQYLSVLDLKISERFVADIAENKGKSGFLHSYTITVNRILNPACLAQNGIKSYVTIMSPKISEHIENTGKYRKGWNAVTNCFLMLKWKNAGRRPT